MNENNEYNSTNITPYKATGNLNTAIGNPSVNINDTMNVNITSVATNQPNIDSNQNYNNSPDVVKKQASIPTNNVEVVNNVPNNVVNNTNNTVNTNVNQNNSYVKKTYVSADNKPKKKNISLNMGPEFKIGLLIIVILLVFVFLLPMLSELIIGY